MFATCFFIPCILSKFSQQRPWNNCGQPVSFQPILRRYKSIYMHVPSPKGHPRTLDTRPAGTTGIGDFQSRYSESIKQSYLVNRAFIPIHSAPFQSFTNILNRAIHKTILQSALLQKLVLPRCSYITWSVSSIRSINFPPLR